MPLHVAVEGLGRAPIGGLPEHLFADEGLHEGTRRLLVLRVHTDVTDLGVGHGDDLAGIGGIGQDLLIAHHARVETHFADTDSHRTKRPPAVDRAVRQREKRGLQRVLQQAHGTNTPLSTW